MKKCIHSVVQAKKWGHPCCLHVSPHIQSISRPLGSTFYYKCARALTSLRPATVTAPYRSTQQQSTCGAWFGPCLVWRPCLCWEGMEKMEAS